jgi:hypothetical protein
VQNETQRTKIEIFAINGRKVYTVLDEELKAGVYSIPITPGYNQRLAQGLYFVRFKAGNTVSTFKLLPFSKANAGKE